MKIFITQILSMAMLLTLPTWVSAQVFNGDLTLSTQAQVDAFDYTEVTGSLTIGYWFGGTSSDINNLQPLSTLTKVGEDVRINNNSQLQDLQGLENLTAIEGFFQIENNASLTSLLALENLSSVDHLSVGDNDLLKNLQGLENISSVNSIGIYSNNQLQDLEGLENLTMINGTLNINNNSVLTSLLALENLSSVNQIGIENNDQLQDLEGLDNISNTSKIRIFNNPKLTALSNLKNITSLNEVNIINNDQLQDLEGLENLTMIHNVLEIMDNDQLQNLQGLNNLSTIGHQNENDQDGEIGVLDIFVYGLIITGNEQLKSLQGLESLTAIDVAFGNLIIENNPSLTSLQGLENLSRIRDEFVSIGGNQSLTSLEGLKSLSTIGEALQISNNPSLVSLQGLESLSSVDFILILNNALLQNLQGLENLQSLGFIRITNNPNLNDCCAIARLLSMVRGYTLSSNGVNCSSEEAIQESCPPVITGFTLVNATTDQDISDLELGNTPAVINISETGNKLNIRANTSPETVGSVVFTLDGVIISKENVAPYALAGDEPPGDYRNWTPTLGRHTLTATPYEGKNGKGQAGEALTLEFVVIDQPLAVVSFTLVTTDDDQDQYELKDGSIISLQQFDPAKLNIRANTYPDEVGSVVFDLNGVKNFRTENVAPYALAGDEPQGEYKDYTLEPGTYWLTATPYSLPRGRGEAGMPLNITFEVVEDLMAVARTMPVTSPKTKDNVVEDVIGELHADQIWVYPNPNEGMLSIRLPDTAQAGSLTLYNAQGYQVMEITGRSEEAFTLDMSHLAAGMYMLKLTTGNMTEMHRILLK